MCTHEEEESMCVVLFLKMYTLELNTVNKFNHKVICKISNKNRILPGSHEAAAARSGGCPEQTVTVRGYARDFITTSR